MGGQNQNQGQGDWVELLPDLLDVIVKSLDSYCDYVRLRAVCKRWNLVLPKCPKSKKLSQLPWLVLPFDDGNDTLRPLYNLIEKKVYHLELPETRNKLFRGSCFGWLVMVERGPTLQLFNPFTRAKIDLPPITTFPDIRAYQADRRGDEYTLVSRNGVTYTHGKFDILKFYITKVVLSSSPALSVHDNDIMAVSIYGEFRTLAYCRLGDDGWTAIPTRCICFEDVIFHEGKIYAVTCTGKVLVCDMSMSGPLKGVWIRAEPPKIRVGSHYKYLVGTSSGLLMVERCFDVNVKYLHRHRMKQYCYKTSGFNIYKLQSRGKKQRWSKVNSLGDYVLLLGLNFSSCILPHNFPDCKPNRIYYTDDELDTQYAEVIGGYDIGVFNLEDGSIERLAGRDILYPPPIWVVPE
ncbi:F-box protein [Quillaja saponaria]|uniref:F-box protein n=1 Tax=Quillaja saponaria TaxID=32244 RepID=A0AAD7P6N1_QUISA|nr:F-box protein [Quillaja saponaria]